MWLAGPGSAAYLRSHANDGKPGTGAVRVGVPDSPIHFEAFGPASIKGQSSVAVAEPIDEATASGSEIIVSFAKSGKQIPWRPAAGSLLEFAEANGITVDSG